MGKRLIVAEKPSVGRDIAHVLNCKNNKNGYIVGDNDIVTWAVGHLVGLAMPEDYNPAYKDWKVEDLPIIPDEFMLKVLSSGEAQFEIIKKFMLDPEIDSIVCATDAGREGELIFRYIYQMAGCAKPVERLWISSLTYGAIKDGFANLKPASEYDNLYYSAKCRSEADWLVGINGTRAFATVNEMRGLSVGRVMSPTLGILVQRELERRNYVPVQYCEVVVDFNGFTGKMINQDKKGEDKTHFSIDQKPELDNFIKNSSSKGTVVFSAQEKEEINSPLLYDLTSLQRDANRIFGMSSQWTLDTAQELYEKKAITYPRTDSRFLTADIKPTFIKRLENLKIGCLKPYAEQAQKSKKDLFGKYINNSKVTDHHAIIPTGEAKEFESWSEAEKRIFYLISRRFIGMFLDDRKTVKQEITISVNGKDFFCAGEKVIQAGWSDVDKVLGKEKSSLPDLLVGDSITVKNMWIRTDKTTPPAPHTEASLLVAMEHAGNYPGEDDSDNVEMEFGIGTPATRARIIEKLIEKEMVVRKGRALIPTEYGIKLASILSEVLRSPELTGKWEAKLAKIAMGKGSSDQFIEEIIALTKEIVSFSVKQGKMNLEEFMYVGKCPICGNWVRENPAAYYCVNTACGFRPIFKAVKGFHPTLKSLTMRELLENKTATTEKGTFSIIEEKPYIAFEYAPKKMPDYKAMHDLIKYYGLHYVYKGNKAKTFWVVGDDDDELLQDFVRDCKKIGCFFEFSADSKTLKGKPGWYLNLEPDDNNVIASLFSS